MVADGSRLKMHGGVGRIVAGKPLDPALAIENVAGVVRGAENLRSRSRSSPVQRARCGRDQLVPHRHARPRWRPSARSHWRRGALDAVVTAQFAEGGAGAEASRGGLGRGAVRAPRLHAPVPGRGDAAREDRGAAVRVYGAVGVDESPTATRALDQFERLGFGRLPICVAKTQYSISHDPSLLGRPSGFRIPDPRCSAVCRRGIRDAAAGGDADDARAAVAAGWRAASTSTLTGTSSACSDREAGRAA